MSSRSIDQPDWDLEQLEIIIDEPHNWQFVVAGPGAGKSAVACQRVAYLVDEGVPPSRILLISFTRTAIAELRNRIESYAVAQDRARNVRISTVDSHAWSLRIGFDDEPIPPITGDGSYDLSIERVVALFQSKQPDLLDFMMQLEHLIIDEAQDVMGVRADLILEMLQSLSDRCGVTILADPAQAIYGFTTDEEQTATETPSLLARLQSESPRPLTYRSLQTIHRIREPELMEVFRQTRQAVEDLESGTGYVGRIAGVIRETCSDDVGSISYDKLTELVKGLGSNSVLVLFRRRADVLLASSYCSQAALQHRLRLSGSPTVVRPWLGWLFGEVDQSFITLEEFASLWDQREASAPGVFRGEDKDAAWTLLHRLAAGRRPNTVDVVQLRQLVSRSKPPVELCLPDVGTSGPILGTIHASKGREADTVVLVLPATAASADGDAPAVVFEEGRVYYVGATRARRVLIVARNSARPVGYLNSRRIYRRLGQNKVQLEIGRNGDVDSIAHLAWTNATEIQHALALAVGQSLPITAKAVPEHDYAIHLELRYKTAEDVTRCLDVAQMSKSFSRELGAVWSIVDSDRNLRPAATIHHLHLVGVTTVALSDEQLRIAHPPFNRSGFALAPLVKGFPTIPFFFRKRRRYG